MHPSGCTALRVYAVVATVAIASHVAVPVGAVAVVSDLVVSLAAVVGCSVGLRMHRPQHPGPWRWLLLGLSCSLLGSVAWVALETAGRDPTMARVFYVAAYGAAAVGVWTLTRHRSGRDIVDRVLASAIIAAAAAIVAWLFVVQPLGRLNDLTGSGHALRAVFPVLSFVLAVMLVRYLASHGAGLRAHWIVTAGLGAFFLADAGQAIGLGAEAHGGTATIRLIGYGLIGMATLHPSVGAPLDTAADGGAYELSRPELGAVLFAGVAAPVSLVVRVDEVTRVELVVLGAGSAVLVTLAVARLWRLLRALTESARRENEDRFRALVENAGDVICVLDTAGEVVYVSPTVERVWGYSPGEVAASGFAMVPAHDRRRLRRLLRQVIAGHVGEVASVEGQVRHADGSARRFEAVYANRIEDPAIHGVVITARDVTGRFDLEQRLWKQAFVDQLTGLPNRAQLLEQTGAALEAADEGTRPVLLVLDLDDFKTINDSLGPQRGDDLLRAIAGRLQGLAGEGATAARLAGDEFAVLLPHGGCLEAAHELAAAAIEVVRGPVVLAGRRIEPRASIGVALGTPGGTANELLRDADAAMHVAKRDARGGVRVFDPEMHADAVRRLQLQMDLGSAIERGQLWVAYQPIHEIRTGRMSGVEALLRWEHPIRGSVPPAEFIPLAESSGAIGPLGEFVLRQGCADLAAYRAVSGEDVSLSVNLSPAQLGDPALTDMVASALADSRLPASRLTLEVTEGVFLEHRDGIVQALSSLRSLGVRLAIDDFGTGYCALGYLTKFRFDLVKIDRSFIQVLDLPGGDRRVTLGILELVSSLEVPAVAEGIETLAQLEDLRAVGCEYGQGYHWSRPVPIAELVATHAAPTTQVAPSTPSDGALTHSAGSKPVD